MSSVRIPRVPTYSGYCRPSVNFAYGIFTLSDLLFQNSSAIHIGAFRSPYPERISTFGLGSSLGSSDFARHYFRNRFYFLFLRVLRCFSSPGSPRNTMDSCRGHAILLHGVPSFGYLRISEYLLLPAAFRSLSRPSSAPCT